MGNIRPDLGERMFVHPVPVGDFETLSEREQAAISNVEMALYQSGDGAATRAQLLAGALRTFSPEWLDAQLKWLLRAGRVIVRSQYDPERIFGTEQEPQVMFALSEERAAFWGAYFERKALEAAERAEVAAAEAAVRSGEREIQLAQAAARVAQHQANQARTAAVTARTTAERVKATVTKAAQEAKAAVQGRGRAAA